MMDRTFLMYEGETIEYLLSDDQIATLLITRNDLINGLQEARSTESRIALVNEIMKLDGFITLKQQLKLTLARQMERGSS